MSRNKNTPNPQFKERLRRQILQGRGLERERHGRLVKPKPVTIDVKLAGTRHLKVKAPITQYDTRKTLSMRLVELRIEQPIEDVLWLGTLAQVAGALGVNSTTICKWRKRLTGRS